MPPPESPPFPWRAVMRFGLGHLRLPPPVFWAMTPREIAAAMGAFDGASSNPPTQKAFAALRAAFPDQPATKGAPQSDR